MKIAYLQVQELAQTIQGVDQKKIVSIALGLAAARVLPLAASSAENDSVAWASVAEGHAKTLVFAFNEDVVTDCDLALEVARNWWTMRVNMAYPRAEVPLSPIVGQGGVAASFFGLNDYVGADILATIEAAGGALVSLVNRITALLAADFKA